MSFPPVAICNMSALVVSSAASVANDNPLASSLRWNCWSLFHKSLYRRNSFGYSPSKACFKNEESRMRNKQIYFTTNFNKIHTTNIKDLIGSDEAYWQLYSRKKPANLEKTHLATTVLTQVSTPGIKPGSQWWESSVFSTKVDGQVIHTPWGKSYFKTWLLFTCNPCIKALGT